MVRDLHGYSMLRHQQLQLFHLKGFHIHMTSVSDQDDTGEFELPTDGYDEISLYGDYHWDLGNAGELKVFVKGNNLTDEEIRNHTSRLKNYAPEPGRSYLLGLRYTY